MLDHKSASIIEKKLRCSNDGILKGAAVHIVTFMEEARRKPIFVPVPLVGEICTKKPDPLAFHLVLLLHFWIFVKTALLDNNRIFPCPIRLFSRSLNRREPY